MSTWVILLSGIFAVLQVLEVVRAFGNLSRDRKARAAMLEMVVIPAMTLLLDHPNRDVVYTTCGVSGRWQWAVDGGAKGANVFAGAGVRC